MPGEMANLDDDLHGTDVKTENGMHVESDSGQSDIGDERTASADARKRLKQEEEVQGLLADAKATGAIVLDLNEKGMTVIPDELLELSQLQYLYLAGNCLTRLPETFFDALCSLRWLDLRENLLASLPSAYVGRHRCLRTLLLEGNALRTLPLELGLIQTLDGLNIASNPLEFPPQEVIEKGTQTVLAFFRELLNAKSQGRVLEDMIEDRKVYRILVPRVEDLRVGTDSDSDSDWGGGKDSAQAGHHRRARPEVTRSLSKEYSRGSNDAHQDLVGPVPHSASLHMPMSYNELRQVQQERLQRAGLTDKPGSGKSGYSSGKSASGSGKKRQKPKAVSEDRLMHYGEALPPDLVHEKYIEEKKMQRLRELKSKQEMIIQKRKDREALRGFQDDSRKLQMRKNREKMMKGGKLEYEDPAETAPYGVDQDHMKVPTNEERIAMDIREKHEKLRRAMSPASLQRQEDQRRERDHELEKRIKDHTHSMQERKRRPKGTPQEEMRAAMDELRVAKQLELEVEARRKELEYRFTAFTGDLPTPTHTRRIKVKEPLAPITPGR